jgi:hypothetical protein
MGAFNASTIENSPVVSEGQNLLVLPQVDYGYFKVLYIEALPGITVDLGAIAAGAETSNVEIVEIYVNDGEIAQYEIQVLDDVELKLKQPLADTRFVAKTSTCTINLLNRDANPTKNMNKIFVFEDDKVFIQAKNPTRYTTPTSRVRFMGWRFMVEKLPSPVSPYTAIPCKGA